MRKIIIASNDLELGGIQKSLIEFLRFLVDSGQFEIDLLLWDVRGALKEEIPVSVNIIKVGYSTTWRAFLSEKNLIRKVGLFTEYFRYNYYSRIRKKPWLFYPEHHSTYDFAISYSHNGYPKFYVIDKIIATQKILWYHHGSYEAKGDILKLDQEYFAKFDKIITVSSSNKEMLVRYFPQLKGNILVIPNMLDSDKIIAASKRAVTDFKKEEGVLNFVTVSRFSKEKGIDLAINIAAELKKQQLLFKWYFIGDGESLPEIKILIQQKKLEEVCLLLGNKKNPYPYMSMADFYIQTSYVESQSITVNEALILNKIVIATQLAPIKEALQNGKVGVLCAPNVEDFTEKIIELIKKRKICEGFQKALEKGKVNNEHAQKAIHQLLHF